MQCRALALVQLQPSNDDFKPREAVLWRYEIVVYDRRSSQMLWYCASSQTLQACKPLKLLWQVLWCLSNCRDVPTLNFAIVTIYLQQLGVVIQSLLIERFVGATNFGWNNIVPWHNSTLSNVDIKQIWCLALVLSFTIGFDWPLILQPLNADVKYDAMWCFGASTTVEMNQR
jgi:hypothetical protein